MAASGHANGRNRIRRTDRLVRRPPGRVVALALTCILKVGGGVTHDEACSVVLVKPGMDLAVDRTGRWVAVLRDGRVIPVAECYVWLLPLLEQSHVDIVQSVDRVTDALLYCTVYAAQRPDGSANASEECDGVFPQEQIR